MKHKSLAEGVEAHVPQTEVQVLFGRGNAVGARRRLHLLRPEDNNLTHVSGCVDYAGHLRLCSQTISNAFPRKPFVWVRKFDSRPPESVGQSILVGRNRRWKPSADDRVARRRESRLRRGHEDGGHTVVPGKQLHAREQGGNQIRRQSLHLVEQHHGASDVVQVAAIRRAIAEQALEELDVGGDDKR